MTDVIREQLRASLKTIRHQLDQDAIPTAADNKAAKIADCVIATSVHSSAEGPKIRELLQAAGDILTATSKGESIRNEILAGTMAKSHLNWMIAIHVLGTCLQNIRDVVCDGSSIKAMTAEFKLTPDDLNMLVSAEIVRKFDLTSYTSRVLAILFFMIFDKAAYKTFCQMTDGQIIEKVTHSASGLS